jgi:hypothetical protein
MTTSGSTHDEGPVRLPERPSPDPQLQTARQRIDGTVEPEGPGAIRPEEVIAPRRWWESAHRTDATPIITAATGPLIKLVPPCPCLQQEVEGLLHNRMTLGIAAGRGTRVWLLVHAPGMPLDALARALADSLFQDPNANRVVDCSLAANSQYGLFGTPPGYRGYLEGGTVTNQLIMRPESIVLFSNFEYADNGTLYTIRNMARDGVGRDLVARGGQILEVPAQDAVFVLATTRSFSDSTPVSRERLLDSLRRARPKLDWVHDYDSLVAYPPVCEWRP